MSEEALSKLNDEELLAEAKKMKSSRIFHAVLIGFMVGIVFYSIAKNTFGFLTLIPVFIAYKLTSKPDHYKSLKKVLADRNLSY